MVSVTGAVLLPGELGHLVHQLGIEKALFFGLRLLSFDDESRHRLRIDSFIDGKRRGTTDAEG